MVQIESEYLMKNEVIEIAFSSHHSVNYAKAESRECYDQIFSNGLLDESDLFDLLNLSLQNDL